MTQQHTSTIPSAPKALTISAWVAVGAVIVQAVLACFMLSGVHGLGDVHMGRGTRSRLAPLAAAVRGVKSKLRGGCAAVVGHAVGMAVLILVQYVLGELSSGGAIKWIHVVLGVVIVIGLLVLPQSIGKNSSK